MIPHSSKDPSLLEEPQRKLGRVSGKPKLPFFLDSAAEEGHHYDAEPWYLTVCTALFPHCSVSKNNY
jgi:hypothetical protein